MSADNLRKRRRAMTDNPRRATLGLSPLPPPKWSPPLRRRPSLPLAAHRRPTSAPRPTHLQLALPLALVPTVPPGRPACGRTRTDGIPAAKGCEPTRRPERSRCGDVALDIEAGRLVDLVFSPAVVRSLPRGLAARRYRCLACGLPLELCGPRTDPAYTARFRHLGRCPAPAVHRARVRTAVEALRTLDGVLLPAFVPLPSAVPTATASNPRVPAPRLPAAASRVPAAAPVPGPRAPVRPSTVHQGHDQQPDHAGVESSGGIRRAVRRWITYLLGSRR